MSDIKLDSDSIQDDVDGEDLYKSEERSQARDYVCGEITRYAVDIMEFYSNKMGKNEALALTIECLSESLGNLISLVHESHQPEVLSASQDVIHQGLINQQELIAQITYGQVGHA
jgi:hypothetical protein